MGLIKEYGNQVINRLKQGNNAQIKLIISGIENYILA